MKFILILFILSLFRLSSLSAMSSSKLSIHTGWGQASENVVNQGKPRLIKFLDNFEAAQQVKNTVPGIVTVGRIYLANQPQDGDPTSQANTWWSQVSSTILQYPAIDYWEGYNEPSVGSQQDLSWLSQFEIARINILASNGRNASLFNFAVGTPDETNPTLMAAMIPAIQHGLKNGAILGLHEYSAPFMNNTYSGSDCGGSGWLTGRYRKLYNQFLLPKGLNIPLVISETGIDCGTCAVSKQCSCSGGWLSLNYSPSQYFTMLEWYDRVLRCDTYVIGCTIFQLDIPNWASFDITQIVPNLIGYLQSN
mmetsp:Transcript_8283/g.12591  ORF Transcript_8283/g.12591 Transcript_8283/m.12591 type:complete len:308 (+) Transcript_8283:3-926(+)